MNKSGWQLKEGQYNKIDLTDKDVWEHFNHFFSSKSVNNTAYKFIFMRSILLAIDSLSSDKMIEYSSIFDHFTRIYWRLYVQEQFRQSRASQKSLVEKEFDKYYETGLDAISFDSLNVELQSELTQKVQDICKKNVIGAVYGDFNGTIYSFSNDQSKLELNPIYFNFMNTYKDILLKLNLFEWMKYIEKENEVISVQKLSYLAC